MIQEVSKSLNVFFNSFGLPAYISNNVVSVDEKGHLKPAELPYITYDLVVGKTLNQTTLACKIWYKGSYMPTGIFETSEKIYEKVKYGACIPCGNGYLWIYAGNPFAQPIETDNNEVSGLYLNLFIEFDLN